MVRKKLEETRGLRKKLEGVRDEVRILRDQRRKGLTNLCLHPDTESDLDLVIEALASLPEWVSVEERLPEEEGYYLVAIKPGEDDCGYKTDQAWYGKTGWDFCDPIEDGYKVVYWTKKPTPPGGSE